MITHTASPEDQAFRQAFETCALQPSTFTHASHLRLVYVYLAQGDVAFATQKMRQSILAFLAGHKLPNAKFHETLTQAWVMAVAQFMQRQSSQSFDEFAQHSASLLDSKFMLRYYSPELLFSDLAKASFVAPDLQPIAL